MSDFSRSWILGFVCIAGLAVTFVVLWVLFLVLSGSGSTRFGDVAALILVGFAAFVVLMNVSSFGASYIGILDRTQPFGLPEGTVRALLTLALIVLVGVLSSYLVTSTANQSPFSKVALPLLQGVSLEDAKSFIKEYKGADGVLSIDAKDGNATPKLYDVDLFPRVDNRLSEDISKQILTMLSTILAAMIGFYFGTRSDPGAPLATPPTPSAADAAKPKGSGQLLDEIADLRKRLPAGADGDPQRATLDGLETELRDIATAIDAADATLASDTQTPAAKAGAQATRDAKAARLAEIAKTLDQMGQGLRAK